MIASHAYSCERAGTEVKTGMGINASFVALLVRAHQMGSRFTETATIGRQSLSIPKKELKEIASRQGIQNIDWSWFAADGFADDFLRSFLGVRSATSLDYSDYQSPDVVHDLNKPIPTEWEGRFDAVIDGGAIEHIFDVRQVLTNYMNMLKVGGGLFILTPANNLCGHGFYQFSPELFYRCFGGVNGFIIKDVILIESPLLSVEASRRRRYFRVPDPAEIQKRIQFVNDRPVMLYVHSERVSEDRPFDENPCQSDYKIKWHRNAVKYNRKEGVDKIPGRVGESPEFEYLSPWEEFRRRLKQRRRKSLHRNRYLSEFLP